MAEQQVAFDVLLDLARRSRGAARGLPAQVEITPHWSGVGFSLLGQRFTVPMGAITEMLEVPSYTHLPGVHPWVLGVANVRGRLLPLFDMAMFFGGSLSGPRKKRRVLVLETETLYSGLIVDEVFGMQHFPIDTFDSGMRPESAVFNAFTSGCYNHRDRQWHVFEMGVLAQEPRFYNAAAS